MLNFLRNPVFRIAAGAAVSTYITPRFVNRFIVPEIDKVDEAANTRTIMISTAATTSFVFVALGMIAGMAPAEAAKAAAP